jgi:hypothetical protein
MQLQEQLILVVAVVVEKDVLLYIQVVLVDQV